MKINFFKNLLYLQLIHDFMIPWFYILRITNTVPGIAHIEKFFFLINFSLLFLFILSRKSDVKINNFCLFFVLVLLYGVCVSILNYDVSVKYFLSSFSSLLFALLAVLTGYNLSINGEDFIKILRKYSWTLILSFLSGYFCYFFLQEYYGYHFYPSFVSQMLFFPVLMFLFDKKYFSVFLLILLMVLAGKRGPLVSLALSVSLYFMMRDFRTIISFSIIAAFSVMLMFLLVEYSNLHTLKKYSMASDLNAEQLITKISSGRDIEIRQGFSSMESRDAMYTGIGHSFHYPLYDRNGNYVESRGYVHVSPFNFIFRFGVVFGGLLVFIVYIFPILKVKKMRSFYLDERIFCVLFFASLINSLFAYTLAYEVFVWVSLGYLMKKRNPVAVVNMVRES